MKKLALALIVIIGVGFASTSKEQITSHVSTTNQHSVVKESKIANDLNTTSNSKAISSWD